MMKTLGVLTVVFAVLALVMGAVVYEIMKHYWPEKKATKVVGWVAVGCAGAMFLFGMILAFVEAAA